MSLQTETASWAIQQIQALFQAQGYIDINHGSGGYRIYSDGEMVGLRAAAGITWGGQKKPTGVSYSVEVSASNQRTIGGIPEYYLTIFLVAASDIPWEDIRDIVVGPRLNVYAAMAADSREIGKLRSCSVSLNLSNLAILVGQSATLTASVYPAAGLSWSSSNSAVASVSGGVVTAKQAGATVITVTDGRSSASCSVRVEDEYEPPEAP